MIKLQQIETIIAYNTVHTTSTNKPQIDKIMPIKIPMKNKTVLYNIFPLKSGLLEVELAKYTKSGALSKIITKTWSRSQLLGNIL